MDNLMLFRPAPWHRRGGGGSMRKRAVRHPIQAVIAALGLLGSWVSMAQATPAPTLSDYKYFRALSVDLLGRIPTRDELLAFEKPGFSVDKWLDDHLQGSTYAARLTRIYADLLRPQINSFRYNNTRNTLARLQVKDDAGKD